MYTLILLKRLYKTGNAMSDIISKRNKKSPFYTFFVDLYVQHWRGSESVILHLSNSSDVCVVKEVQE